jgi:hypothetical protein
MVALASKLLSPARLLITLAVAGVRAVQALRALAAKVAEALVLRVLTVGRKPLLGQPTQVVAVAVARGLEPHPQMGLLAVLEL